MNGLLMERMAMGKDDFVGWKVQRILMSRSGRTKEKFCRPQSDGKPGPIYDRAHAGRAQAIGLINYRSVTPI